MRRLILLLALSLSCKTDPEPEPETPSPLLDVGESAKWSIPGMTGTAYVLYGEMGIPYVYAENRGDLGRALGFTLARDRYFYMDLARRLAQGRVAALLGADALETDLEGRMTAMGHITDRVVTLLDADPEMKAYFEGVAEGVNAYIAAVAAGTLQAPTEYEIAHPLLGKASAAEVMQPFEVRDVAAGLVTVLFESGFETKDVGRAADAERLATTFAGAPEEALRTAGLYEDVWNRTEAVYDVPAAPDWQAEHPPTRPPERHRGPGKQVAPGMLQRLQHHTERISKRFSQDWNHGFGSNAWAVSGAASADGRAMVATDGHLSLSVPPLFYQVGIDTKHLGGGEIEQVGMMTPAMPLISTGTNGKIAFGQTQLMGDITDWYREEITLDANGAPASARFQGNDVALVPHTETFDIASVPLLGSAAGTLSIVRYTTADGRWITSVEGRPVGGPDEAGEGETAINLLGDWLVPGDADGDGTITAVSFDYAGLDLSNMAATLDRYTKAQNLDQFETATHDLVAYSLNLVAADDQGGVFYTGFQAVPCRTYLDRNPDGTWADGADPNALLDGTRYGGFTIPITAEGRVDFTQAGDPYRCVVPPAEYPHARNPEQGFLVSANQDPGGLSYDGSLTNDRWYIGGPWIEGYRAKEIHDELSAQVAGDKVSVADMQRIQGDHSSTIGKHLLPELLDAIELARTFTLLDADLSRLRTATLYAAHGDRIDEAFDRLSAWADRGMEAKSGVVTFYDTPTADDTQDAVATMIFNAWMGRYLGHTIHDEGFPGLGWPTGDSGRFRVLKLMLDGRGEGNPLDLGSFNPDTNESIYFDDKNTPVVERSEEVAVMALIEALDFLTAEPTGPGTGGFGTDDMDQWLWGLRHWVRFTSLLGDFIGGGDPIFDAIIGPLNITPETFPIAEGIPNGDPRADLPGFPRNGDHLVVDAANSGTSGTSFDYGSGPVWRLVVALGGSGFEAWNILPGGQSGIADTEHFADQAKLWLGNDAVRVYLGADDVAAHATRRETFTAP